MGDSEFVLYTYQTITDQLVCHAYAANGSTQQGLVDLGEHLAAATPGLGFMVLSIEPLPADPEVTT